MKGAGAGNGVASIDVSIGDAIKRRRLDLGIGQDQLAGALDIEPSQLERYEAGIDRVGAVPLLEISKALDVAPGHFFEVLNPAVGS